MKSTNLFLWLVLLFASAVHAELPESLAGAWTIHIENMQHEVITTLTFHFTDGDARSCQGGSWKKIVVDSHTTKDGKFFPVDDPLSYMFEKNKLFIGRNEICDAYLELRGDLVKSKAIGEYVAFGWGDKQLGYFSLKRGGKE